jgi:hypothetical protein
MMLCLAAACSPCVIRDGLTEDEWAERERRKIEPLMPAARDSSRVSAERFAVDSPPRGTVTHFVGALREYFFVGGALGLGGPLNGRSCIPVLNAPAELSVYREVVWLTRDSLVVATEANSTRPTRPVLFNRKAYRLDSLMHWQYDYRGSDSAGVVMIDFVPGSMIMDVAPSDSAKAQAFLA